MSNNVLKTSESFNNRRRQRFLGMRSHADALASKWYWLSGADTESFEYRVFKHWSRIHGRTFGR